MRRPSVAEYLLPTAHPDYGVRIVLGNALVIGCEGYWVINPNTVGIPRPHWQPRR